MAARRPSLAAAGPSPAPSPASSSGRTSSASCPQRPARISCCPASASRRGTGELCRLSACLTSSRQRSTQERRTLRANRVGSSAAEGHDDDADDEQHHPLGPYSELLPGELKDQQGLVRDKPTELIWKLDRRGHGWGEEIIPFVTLEQREIKPPKRRHRVRNRRRDNNPEPWEEGSLERFLEDSGVPKEEIENIVIEAVAWRVTPGGRPLIDRRRRARVERNMHEVSEYLVEACGIEKGGNGVGKILTRAPQILLCKPSTFDRWDRRAVQLAAFLHKFGHTNVPEEYEESPELTSWVKRQRVTHAQGNLSMERKQILVGMGFVFGEIAQMTDEWERFFDQLIEWQLWNEGQVETFTWDIETWGPRGGPKARRLAIWVQLQREFKRRALLPTDAVRRLNALSLEWEQPGEEGKAWANRFGQLIYLQEEAMQAQQPRVTAGIQAKPDTQAKAQNQKRQSQPPQRMNAQVGWRRPFNQGGGPTGGGHVEADVPFSAAAAGRMDTDGGETARSRRAPSAAFPDDSGPRQEIVMQPEPGVGFWLAKQRWLWARGRLDRERLLLLSYASIDMDTYGPSSWADIASRTAHILSAGSRRRRSQGNSAGGVPGRPGRGPPLKPLHMQRFVLVQNALWRQKGLSPGRLKQLQELGIEWILADEVMWMGESQWQGRFGQLKRVLQGRGIQMEHRGALMDWLHHQRCLRRLNLLSVQRIRQLEGLFAEEVLHSRRGPAESTNPREAEGTTLPSTPPTAPSPAADVAV
mmetsp:Transcript_20593/g.57143  ORF Transcript_20593/g.57143 Transcript_20593/m.57143 type:complete len:755 (+) Transcript_20593:162-2426(+)